MGNQMEQRQEFGRLFEKATGKRLTEDEAGWHLERLIQLYQVLLRSPRLNTPVESPADTQSASHTSTAGEGAAEP